MENKFETNWGEFLGLLDAFSVMSMEDKISISNGTQTMVVSRRTFRDLVRFARSEMERQVAA